MKILLIVCLAVAITVSVARPPRRGGPPRHGGSSRDRGPSRDGGRSQRMSHNKGFPPMGPPPLDEACRIDDRNGNTIENNPDVCQSCAECSVGPFPAHQNDIDVLAYFCRYHSVFHDMEKRACLIENVTEDSVIRRHRCHDSHECDVGPVTMTLRDDSEARLYFCEMNEAEDSDEETETDEEDGSRSRGHSREHRRGRPGKGHRGPPKGEGPEKPHKPIIDQLRDDACKTVNSTDNSVIFRKDCCDNCTGGPVTIATDDGELQLFYCEDRVEGGKFPPPPHHGGPPPPPGGPPPPPGGPLPPRQGGPPPPPGGPLPPRQGGPPPPPGGPLPPPGGRLPPPGAAPRMDSRERRPPRPRPGGPR